MSKIESENKFTTEQMAKSISPLDGRYGKKTFHLGEYFSEFALMKKRTEVELKYLLALNETGLFVKFTKKEVLNIKNILKDFKLEYYSEIKNIEKKLNHDVKSVEVFLIEKLSLKNPNMIHFGLTSEDINNLSYSLLLKEYLKNEQLLQIEKMMKIIFEKADEWKSTIFPARTHGQMASPTTAGKEMSVFLNRLFLQYKRLSKFKFCGKLNGATGNYSAMYSAFPKYNWIKFSNNFIKSLGLVPNEVTTQIDSHDIWAEYFSIIIQINNILIDLDKDIWLYLMLGYFTISSNKNEVGSSTMPHKINPINFENSEGNLELSNSMLEFFIRKLTNSRLQRDLSDSTVSRNLGVGLTHAFLGLNETITGLKKVNVNIEKCKNEIESHPELLAEPIQTILRRVGLKDPYNEMKKLTRGKIITEKIINNFIENLQVDKTVKNELKKLSVVNYIGQAEKVTQNVLNKVKKYLK
ncbi:MAG: adenylosuccinate lyase [Candidatus Marinimicrobia bacterium]|nr:adenylosuccinate lyase [Candidatus Neomarinimicrobiota bacterium]